MPVRFLSEVQPPSEGRRRLDVLEGEDSSFFTSYRLLENLGEKEELPLSPTTEQGLGCGREFFLFPSPHDRVFSFRASVPPFQLEKTFCVLRKQERSPFNLSTDDVALPPAQINRSSESSL